MAELMPKPTVADALRGIKRALDDIDEYPARTNGRAHAKKQLLLGIERLVDAKIEGEVTKLFREMMADMGKPHGD